MKALNNKSYATKLYITGSAQKRRREALDKVKARRLAKRQAKQVKID